MLLETSERWRPDIEAEGIGFTAAPEFAVFPTKGRHLKPYEAVAAALETTRPAVRSFEPDVVVHDILTLAPALAAELENVPAATLIPHLNPVTADGLPPFGLGAPAPRTAFGRALWGTLSGPVRRGLTQGMDEYDELRRRVGLAPRRAIHGALSERLVIVGTFPQLETGRELPDNFRITGPLFWEPPFGDVALPAGDAPLVLVAPSTAQDPQHRVLLAALEGLGDLPIRVIATWNRRPLPRTPPISRNTELVEWLSYSRTIPECSAVVSHAGHGTLARTLQSGAIPIAVPWSGDQFENAARISQYGLGVRLPARLLGPRSLRSAVELALSSQSMETACSKVAAWSQTHEGAKSAADLTLELVG